MEISAAELAFTPDEMDSLFSQVYQLPLDRSALSKLAERSQGWVAGLILFRDALRKAPAAERAILLDRLALTEELYDYLAAEVWRHQSLGVQRFLLATAILDPVTPRAATALTGEPAPLRLLRQVERAGLFVTCDNPQTGAYRYHPLLRDFLRQRLQVEAGEQAVSDLHRRAAIFFHSTADHERAIAHALEGQDWESTADWTESVAEETLSRGRLTTLIGWLDRLPPDLLQARPWLILWRGRARGLLGESTTGESDIAKALALFQSLEDRRGVASARVTWAGVRFRRGDYAGAAQDARSVLTENDPATAMEHAEASDWLGCSLVERGDLPGAEEAFRQALMLHQAQGNLVGQAIAYHHLASAALLRGNMSTAERQSQQALALFRKLGDFEAALPLLRLTEIYHLRGEQDQAIEVGNQALRLGEAFNLALIRAYALTYRADALAALGQVAQAEKDYREALAIGEQHGEPSLRILPLLGISCLRLTNGQMDAARVAELERRGRTADDPALRAAVLVHLGDVRECREDAPGALQYWRQAETLWTQLNTEHEIARLKIRQASLARSMGDLSWREVFCQALQLSDARGYAFLFVRTERTRALPLLVAALGEGVEPEHAGRLLTQIGHVAVMPLLAKLSDREPEAQARIAQVLGDIGDRQAGRSLRRLQRDADPRVRETATAALRRIALQPAAPLRLFTLGSFCVMRGDEVIAALTSGRKAPRRLLKILIAKRGQTVPREVLIDLLWREADVATGLKRLKALVHDLRRVLEPDLVSDEPSSYIALDGDGYVFRLQASAWVDADEFAARVRQADRLAHQGLTDEALVEYKAADALCRGNFMEEDLYEDWCALERESLREIHLHVLDALAAGDLARNQYDRAADAYRRALGADPLRESAHRGLMIALARSGHRAEALHQYQTCRKVLREEIKAEPMPEIQALYQRLLRQESV